MCGCNIVVVAVQGSEVRRVTEIGLGVEIVCGGVIGIICYNHLRVVWIWVDCIVK